MKIIARLIIIAIGLVHMVAGILVLEVHGWHWLSFISFLVFLVCCVLYVRAVQAGRSMSIKMPGDWSL